MYTLLLFFLTSFSGVLFLFLVWCRSVHEKSRKKRDVRKSVKKFWWGSTDEAVVMGSICCLDFYFSKLHERHLSVTI